jgi:ubiquinone/menaquinone biosynthesis C-methylase UbiE
MEAEFFCALLGTDIDSLMELGSGIGAMASSVPKNIRCVLVDQSEEMLDQSRIRNPSAEHICSSVAELNIDDRVDAVLIHDAVMYMDTPQKLSEMLSCAYRHLKPEGHVLVVPDVVHELFEEHSLSGGAQEGERAVQVLEWHWMPTSTDSTYQLEFSLLMRENGVIRMHHESHTLGLYTIQEYEEALCAVGFQIVETHEEGRYFLAQK